MVGSLLPCGGESSQGVVLTTLIMRWLGYVELCESSKTRWRVSLNEVSKANGRKDVEVIHLEVCYITLSFRASHLQGHG